MNVVANPKIVMQAKGLVKRYGQVTASTSNCAKEKSSR